MRMVKRIEVVIDALQLGRFTQLLDQTGVSGYTVLPNARGRGRRGVRADDEITGAFKNAYIVIACPPEEMEQILDGIRPVLKRFGGICLISDVGWVEH